MEPLNREVTSRIASGRNYLRPASRLRELWHLHLHTSLFAKTGHRSYNILFLSFSYITKCLEQQNKLWLRATKL